MFVIDLVIFDIIDSAVWQRYTISGTPGTVVQWVVGARVMGVVVVRTVMCARAHRPGPCPGQCTVAGTVITVAGTVITVVSPVWLQCYSGVTGVVTVLQWWLQSLQWWLQCYSGSYSHYSGGTVFGV